VHDQRLSVSAQPDYTAGGLQLLGVLADDTDARLGPEHVARGVDPAVAHDDALDRPEPGVGDRPLDVQGRVGHPGGVGRGLLAGPALTKSLLR
jgi:hypothetical protein